jgi:hypothetical protein
MKKLLFLLLVSITIISCSQNEITPEEESEEVVELLDTDEIDEVKMLGFINKIRAEGYYVGNVTYPSVDTLIWSNKLKKVSQFLVMYMFENNGKIGGSTLDERFAMVNCDYIGRKECPMWMTTADCSLYASFLGFLEVYHAEIMSADCNRIGISKIGKYYVMVVAYKQPK